MIRTLFLSLLAVHALVHLIGLARRSSLDGRQSRPKTLISFSDRILKIISIGWLLAVVLIVAGGVAYFLHNDRFWLLLAAGLVLSEALIIIYWHEAKWGTVVNLLVMTCTVWAATTMSYDRMVAREITRIVEASSKNKITITGEMTAKMPPVIQNWLNKANLRGKAFPRTVHVIQKGAMRSDKNSSWMPFEAEQYFTLQPPAFVWNAQMHFNSIVDITGRDKFENGKGNMLIKGAKVVTIANSSGLEIDQGSVIRFMAEIMWFPHAALCDYMEWEQLDAYHARATMRYNDVTATGVYTFNAEGFPVGFEAQRYGEFDNEYKLETWSIAVTGFRNFDNIPIGNTSEVTWKLDDGDFTWLKLEALDITY